MICFKDLSYALKTAVIITYIVAVDYFFYYVLQIQISARAGALELLVSTLRNST